jgi:hypothetical protein
VAGTSEYGKCIQYYHQQEQAFHVDRAFCDGEADGTYPRSLYDTGHYQPVYVHGGFGPYGNYYGGGVSQVYVEPDYYRNAQIDSLRDRIVAPCMDARGWISADTWQAGRKTIMKAKPRVSKPVAVPARSLNELPWLQ